MYREDVKRCFDLAEGNVVSRAVSCAVSPGLRAIAVFRLGQRVRRFPAPVRLALLPFVFLLNEHIKSAWGIAIGRNATIGPGFYIGHFGGIIISSGATLGANCTISQGVTIGVSGRGGRRGCPTIGHDVYIAPGAKVFGPIHIGDHVQIGANAVIHKDIPDHSIAVAPGGFEIISMDSPSGRVADDAGRH